MTKVTDARGVISTTTDLMSLGDPGMGERRSLRSLGLPACRCLSECLCGGLRGLWPAGWNLLHPTWRRSGSRRQPEHRLSKQGISKSACTNTVGSVEPAYIAADGEEGGWRDAEIGVSLGVGAGAAIMRSNDDKYCGMELVDAAARHSELVQAASGEQFELRYERAPRPGLWSHGPWRLWSLLTRDRSWWVTVESSALGRFLRVDPIEGGSANDYEYAFGDPVNGLDLSGEFVIVAPIVVIGIEVLLVRLAAEFSAPDPLERGSGSAAVPRGKSVKRQRSS